VTALNRVFTSRRFSAVPSLPLYLRVKKLVNDAISAEELRGGDAIPSERDAAELLGVSRVTVRKAFTELVHDGVLVQRRGSAPARTAAVAPHQFQRRHAVARP